MIYFPLSVLNICLKVVEKRHLRGVVEPQIMRARFEFQARLLFQATPFTTLLPVHLDAAGTLPALWVTAKNANLEKVILYLHGGGYFFGSPSTHAAMLARLSEMSGMSCLLPEYRKAPEHQFPGAVDDAVAAYKYLLDRGYAPENIALGGDSAGGGLAFGLLHVICSQNLPRPGAIFGLSPWSDLTLSGETLRSNAKAEAILPVERLPETVAEYLGAADPSDPRASPLLGDFTGAPPVLIQVGDKEILLDDSRRLGAALQAQGVDATVDVWPDVPHVWQIFQGRLRQADQALVKIAAFLASHI